MGNVNFGIDHDDALWLAAKYSLNAFVETGTYKGGTALWAAQHFERVITIEKDVSRQRKTIAAQDGRAPLNLTFWSGDSRTELARALEVMNAPCLIWLDAHFCGGSAEAAHALRDECPLLDELTAIKASKFAAQHVILIDDARLFTQPPPYPHDPTQWPTYDEIAALLAPRPLYIANDVIYVEGV